MRRIILVSLLCGLSPLFLSVVAAEAEADASVSKPVKVFILLGQSNMVGAGRVKGDRPGTLTHAVKQEGLYPFLVDESGAWSMRKDVRNVRVMGSGTGPMRTHINNWMTVQGGRIGPELGIGHELGNAVDGPVMVLKSCIGNRSLGWDLLPPGSEPYVFEDKGVRYRHAGYRESPLRWEEGTEPKPIGWYAGMQYDGDVANAKQVLEQLNTYYPGAKEYEIAGFFFWQGDKDRYQAAHAAKYEENLVRFIEQLRKDFDAPEAPFVCATLGQTGKEAGGTEGQILKAQLAVDGESGTYPRFKGNVGTVYTHPISQGGSSNGHYNGNAKTYMDVGLAMGRKMVELMDEE